MENERGRPTISPWIMATRSALPFLVLACILLGSVLNPYSSADRTHHDSMTSIADSTGDVANERAFAVSEQGSPGNSQECIATTRPLDICQRFRPRNVTGLNLFSGRSKRGVFAADNILDLETVLSTKAAVSEPTPASVALTRSNLAMNPVMSKVKLPFGLPIQSQLPPLDSGCGLVLFDRYYG